MALRLIRSTALCVALAAISTAALAEAPKEKEWSARITPYLWLPAVDGDMSYNGQSDDISLSIQDVLSSFGGAVFINGAVEWRRFIVMGDFIWARLTDDATSQTVSVGPGPLPIEAGPLSVDTTLNEYSFALSAGYRILDQPFPGVTDDAGPQDPRRLFVDTYVGGRYWYIDQRIDLSLPPATVGGTPIPGGGRNVRVDPNDWWVDLQLGMLIGARPWKRWSFGLGGAIGGFGIGSSSDFSWNAALIGNWHFGERWSLNLAYHGLGFDRRFGSGTEGLSLNLVQHGPLLGLTYQF